MAKISNLPEILVNGARIKLTQQMYVAAGGEATIYRHHDHALRIYHDQAAMPPVARLNELSRLTPPNIVKPIHIITDAKTGNALGFDMLFVADTEPLCRLFTGSFKKANNIDLALTTKLVVAIQETVGQIITDGCLPVDLNELNVLVGMKDWVPYFIDIASWATPSFPATAIMENVRDPMVHGNSFTAGSTWYSFGVIATQLYLGIHPFHGMHPTLKMDWKKRMQANASIFEPGVKVPPVVPAFSVIPKRHLDWLKKLFHDSNFRDAPPLPGDITPVPITPAVKRAVNATGNCTVTNWFKAPQDVVDVYTKFGSTYVVTTDRVYYYTGSSFVPIFDRTDYRRVFLTMLDDKNLVITAITPQKMICWHYSQVGGVRTLIDETEVSSGIFARNDRLYSAVGTQLLEHRFMPLGARVVHTTIHVDNINTLTSRFFDGVVFQDLFGSAWITIPYNAGETVSKPIRELNGYRIIDAKMVGPICAVIGEKNRDYSLFILAFDSGYNTYKIREVKGVREINFTLTPNNICVMIINDQLELFKDPSAVKVVDNPPVDYSTRLFMTPDGVHFIDGVEVQKLSVR